MSLFVSVCLLVLVAVTAHARTLSEIRRYGLMQVPHDFMKTLIHDPSDGAAPEKMTYSSWGKFMRLTDYQRPSPQSPPPPESSDSPDQSTKRNTSPCLGDRLCTSALSAADNYIIRSMVDYKKDPSSPPPPPSSSQPPITVAKPSASPPLPPSSSQPPITVANPSASPPPSPSSSSSPIMVAKASASPPPPPESSKSPTNIPYNSLQIPTRASS